MSSLIVDFTDDEELTEFHQDPIEQADEEEISIEDATLSKRGRKKIPEKWTKVITLSTVDIHHIKLFEIASDLLMAPNLPKLAIGRPTQNWRPNFWTKQFV